MFTVEAVLYVLVVIFQGDIMFTIKSRFSVKNASGRIVGSPGGVVRFLR